jgi:PAS domain S-box-containing protein
MDVSVTQSRLVRYAVAILVTAAAVGLRMAMSPLLGDDRVPYITLFAALLFVGWFSGVMPGLLCVLLGAAAVTFFILPPIYSLTVDDPHMFAGMLTFIVMGSVCVLMGNAVARTERRALTSERLAIAQRRELERAAAERERLAIIVESSDDAIVAKDLNGVITDWNKGAERLFGYSREEAIGRSVTMLIPEDRFDEEPHILSRIRQGLRIEHYETVRQRKDGSRVHISLSVSPLRDSSGRIIGASKIARDMTERRQQDEALAQYRTHLEELVRARTAEVVESQSRLRHSERLASIGTLSAGLGHDIGNMLLPLDTHVLRLKNQIGSGTATVEATDESFAAINRAVEYLRDLSNGLRMLTRATSDRGDADAAVELEPWWKEVRPLVAALTGRSIGLRHEFEPGVPPVRLAKHLLTQVVFNLVQNAVHALADRSDGIITIRAMKATEQAGLVIEVTDNGRGMDQEVRQRCLEPFFTTKTRGISSGLGLAIVNGIVANADGSLEIDSEVGRGTRASIRLPAAGDRPTRKLTAEVTVEEPRLRAMVVSMLSTSAIQAHPVDIHHQPNGQTRLWVVDASVTPDLESRIARFLNRDDGIGRRVLVLNDAGVPVGLADGNVTLMNRRFRPSEFRMALERIVQELPAS